MPSALSSANYNVNNQLTQFGTSILTYDASGNLTGDGVNTYTWNARNQMVSINGGVAATFQYDALGRRVSKTVGFTTQFLYDGVNPVQEMSGTTASANLLSGGVDEVFWRTDATGGRNFLTDTLGSTLALSDSTGTLQTQYTFEPFGNTAVTGTVTTNSFAYTGRELDASGLYFYRARYYSPKLQRFISPDPIGFIGGDANLYVYTSNSPTNYTDSSGKDRKPLMGQDNPPWSAYVPPSTPSRVFRGYNAKPPYQPTYPPNSLPNPPDEPINPTGEPPELDPPPPGGIDDNWVPPDPTKLSPWDKTKFIILKIFEGIGETEIVIPFAVVPPCYNVLSVPGAQSGCA